MLKMPPTGTGPNLRVIVFGMGSAGKTTLLTALWNASDHDLFSEATNRFFEMCREGLRQGRPTASTKESAKLPPKLQFRLESSPPLVIQTNDYAGEQAKAFLETEHGDVRQMLPKSDAVLLLLDSYQLCQAESFKTWAEKASLDNLFRWIREILGARYRRGLPFYIACSRSDLVSPDNLDALIGKVREFANEQQLSPAIHALSVFGHHRAMQDIAPDELDDDFLVPRGDIMSEPVEAILRELHGMHARRAKTPVLRWGMGLFALVVLAVVAVHQIVKPSAANIEDVLRDIVAIQIPQDRSEVIMRFPTIPRIETAEFPLAVVRDHFRTQFREDPAASSQLDRCYVDTLMRASSNVLQSLRYNLDEGRWHDKNSAAFVRECEGEFDRQGLTGPADAIRRHKASVLEQLLPKATELPQKRRLAEEYGRIQHGMPSDLRASYTALARPHLLGTLEQMLASAKDYKTLYEEEIPQLVNDTLADGRGLLDGDFEAQLRELASYSSLVGDTTSVTLSSPSLRRVDGKKSKLRKLEVQCNTGQHYVLNMSGDSMIAWKPGTIYEIVADINLWGPDTPTSWRSGDYSTRFAASGRDVPGLGFLIFLDCSENGRTYRDVDFRLRFSEGSTVERLGKLPRLLIEANKKR